MLNAVLFCRISRWCYLHHIPMIPQLVTLFIFLVYNSKIPYKAKIGKGTFFGYGGMGVVVHSDSFTSGHGPGLTIILTSREATIHPVLDSNANIANYLNIK